MKKLFVSGLFLLLLPMTSCSLDMSGNTSKSSTKEVKPLVTGAIPDQDPEKLQRQYTKLAAYLQKELGVPVQYKPVTDYTAAVTAFKVGDLDLVWFGGLTGVQARLQVPGAEAIAQRDVDEKFHSDFIANKKSNLKPLKDIADLKQLKGRTFTFGSESSTSGRLMPQYFLEKAGLKLTDFKGEVGFSGDHDKTIKLVEAGTYEVGAVNEKVWLKRVSAKEVDLNKVQVIWRTPAFYDYHWIINPQVKQRYGEDFTKKVQNAFLKLNPNVPEQKEILDLFQAQKFITTKNQNYNQIEEIGRGIGKIK
ncbi:putative selenate ABC transporter substrate-binding protein [Aetokthonos hydrillicola Thurmond2011]|jgi:phosphonate transport system substrate-binding protein|uniref:Selenate ABC transporter substrate-binding protein n=1 Tax=Aetokthonos hydrillicola Thurmond2011 TaxID=2712845 RepID=A0AAP5IGQ0_9CYAN|nr:putative selenate ABC transporter substrate-binding protein [Aetokthonos hydrillicola]MBO3462723.1 putative selenate ABC transporter substrate-binding protein [Aetokthonos hydrillicola CCALA 1050]MBW4585241.1 putative selenate ABC transporter substrate-binding protein [Aetokthonos hydrillicola CCALA 1050]MDR9899578.1 putative selenate ABC transporter substrate-binding protein [Aetokthonos hydrillicola Thurmond2011]